jgi:hypothetical protein
MQGVTGVFRSQDQAENAVKQLRSLGIPDKRIGIVRPGTQSERLESGVPVTDTEEPGMGRAMGATVGGAMGAAGGATAGLAVASLVVPGIGPLLAFGMLGAALLGTVGAAAGSAVGDSVEEELGEGIPHEDLYLYEDALRHGHTVLIAYAEEGDQADNAAVAIRAGGAEDLDELRENKDAVRKHNA